MSLALTNTDNINNYYHGFRTSFLVFSSDSIGLSFATLRNWINSSFAGTFAEHRIFGNGTPSFALILPAPFETLTTPPLDNNDSSGKGRFFKQALGTVNNNPSSLGVNGYVPIFGNNISGLSMGTPNRVYYCVLNSLSLNVFSCQFSGSSLTNTSYSFISMGWLKNPLYPGGDFPRNAYFMSLDSNSSLQGARTPAAANIGADVSLRVPTGTSPDSIANYSITCQSSTLGANTTDLVLRSDSSPHSALGVVPNLLKTSLAIPVGQIYRNTGVDPDGSNNQFWICVGVYGNERILMRVWTEGLI